VLIQSQADAGILLVGSLTGIAALIQDLSAPFISAANLSAFGPLLSERFPPQFGGNSSRVPAKPGFLAPVANNVSLRSRLQTLTIVSGKLGNKIALSSLRLIGTPKGCTMKHYLHMAATQQAWSIYVHRNAAIAPEGGPAAHGTFRAGALAAGRRTPMS
jgi:hypothetical protein